MRNISADKVMGKLQSDYNKVSFSFAKSRDRLWPELKFLFDYSRKKEKVLDLGCGNGRFSQYLESAYYIGVDFSEELIREAKKRFPNKKFFCGNAINLPFKNSTFDKVYSIAVIHQIPGKINRKKAFFEIKRVLKKGGMAFVVVWDVNKKSKILKKNPIEFFSVADDESRGFLGKTLAKLKKPRNFFLKRDRYYYIFKKGELSKLASDVGFKVEKEGVVKEGTRSSIYIILRK